MKPITQFLVAIAAAGVIVGAAFAIDALIEEKDKIGISAGVAFVAFCISRSAMESKKEEKRRAIAASADRISAKLREAAKKND